MINRLLVIVSFLMLGFNSFAQTDFPALQKQFLDYRKADKQDSAFYIALKMNQLSNNEQTDTSYWYALSFRYLGNPHYTWGNKDSTISYWKKSIDLFEKYHSESTVYANSLIKLGDLYYEMGDYKSAEPMFKQSIEITRKALGEEHPDVAMRFYNLGIFYDNMGDYPSAESMYKQSIEIYKKSAGKEHPDVAMSSNNLGVLYYNMGDYKSAEPLFKQSLEIYKKALGEENLDVAMSLNNLGDLHHEMGNYKSAEHLYKQAFAIYKKVLGEDHVDVADILINLGIFYYDMGNFHSAERLFKQALTIYKETLGEEHQNVAMSLINLGNIYFAMGDNESAERLFKQSLEIYKKTLGEEHPDFAGSLNNLGMMYSDIGDYQSAEPLYKQSLAIFRKVLGEEATDVAMTLSNLANLYSEMGDYKSAEHAYIQSLEIYKKSLGDEHPEVADRLLNLGILYDEMGDYSSAEANYQMSFEKKISQLNLNFSWLSSDEKEAFWQVNNGFYFYLYSFSAKASVEHPFTNVLAFNGSLISKSLLLETSRELDQAISQSSDQDLKSQFSEMKQLRIISSKMQSEGYENKEIMKFYLGKADSLDKILVNKLGEYAASKRKFEITWKDVQSNLSSSDAAIEFARYYDYKDSLYKYMALVVQPNYEYPKLVKLGEESNIRLAAQNKDFSTLYDLIWKDIDTLLKGVQTVYYSPAGELNSVSFSAMCFEVGDSVLQHIAQNRGVIITTNNEKSQSCNAVLLDKYTLHQLTTTRYLADGTLNKTKPMNSSLALYGGINYDDLPIKSDSISTEITNEEYAFQLNLSKTNSNKKINKKRGKKRSSSNFGEKLEYLPGTKEEITNIAVLMNNSKWEVLSRSDKGTGEYEFKKDLETKVPGVLHIATHGFAFPDELKKETNLLDLNQTSTYKISEDPMVRCGLLFSGANISWMGNPQKMIEQTGDDGILTAAEVANLDLSNTKLVVLSACETGLGKIEGSEGTFGLKRGFKLAGVEQIIVSLWSVPDKETMELMTLFYSDLTKTLNPVSSFEKAQKEMRNLYPTEPEKWAGFVLVR